MFNILNARNKKTGENVFTSTNALKILSFLAENPIKEFLGSEIQKAVYASRAGVYIALKELIKQKLVLKTHKGKFLIYALSYDDPAVKCFKVLKNILLLKAVVLKLKALAEKIILYGSSSRGEDNLNSDIDLFILSKEPQIVKELLAPLKMRRKIQAIIKTPSDFADFQEKEKVFCEEIDRGIVLLEKKE